MQDKSENISQKRVFLGENVKNARKASNLTQVQLAEMLGFTRDFIQSIEIRGTQPKYEDLFRIANFFRLSFEDLLFKCLTVDDLMKVKIVNKQNSTLYIHSGSNSIQNVNDSNEVYIQNNSNNQSGNDLEKIIEENNQLRSKVSFLEGQVQLLRELMNK